MKLNLFFFFALATETVFAKEEYHDLFPPPHLKVVDDPNIVSLKQSYNLRRRLVSEQLCDIETVICDGTSTVQSEGFYHFTQPFELNLLINASADQVDSPRNNPSYGIFSSRIGMKRTSLGYYTDITGMDNNFIVPQFCQEDDWSDCVYQGNLGLSEQMDLPSNTDFYITLAYDETSFKVYVNDDLVDEVRTESGGTLDNKINFCASRGGGDKTFTGTIQVVSFIGERECPTLSQSPSGPYVGGDPHIKTWVGKKFDFHGVCDLVMLSNPGFDNGRGMNIHIRNKRTRVWSYISTAAVSIGEEILQIMGGAESNKYFLNRGEEDADSNNGAGVLGNFAGYELKYQRISDVSVEYEVVLDNGQSILFKTWNGFVSVKVNHPLKKDFDGSLGLLGSYPTGVKLARDNETIISDSNEFGQEWQVIETEQKLFNGSEGPQFPEKCQIPTSVDMRRRLASSSATIEMAKTACALVSQDDKDLCIFDVLATNSIETAGAY